MSRSDLPKAADVAVLAARLQSQFIREAPPRELFEGLLPDLLAASASRTGFIAEVVRRDDGRLEPSPVVPATPNWDAASHALLQASITGELAAFSNEGPHPQACVPLFHGRVLVGVVGLGARRGGYDAALLAHFEVLWIALGAIIGAVQLARQRRAAAETLQQREALWHRLTEHLPAAIFQFRRDASGWMSMPFATQGLRRMFGLQPDAVRTNAQPLALRVHVDDRPRLRASIDESARRLRPWRLEYRVYGRDNEPPRWHEGHALPEREADGGVLWHGYVVDITERKQYDDALVSAEAAQRANQAKTEFLSRMSHELRTPLNAVIGFAQLLRLEAASLTEQQRSRVTHIEHAGAHLLAMINDVLDLSRIEAGTMPLSTEPLAVAAVVDESLALVGGQSQQAGVALQPPRVAPNLMVRADRVRLRQVLVNLLSNAIKYNRKGGLVEVHAILVGPQVQIAVVDTGIGLTPLQLAHLWEPFNRLGAERTSIEGTGIGLALTQRMVGMMDGRLEVHSEPGRGSTFTVCLPAFEAPAAARGPAPPAVRDERDRRCVLYADATATETTQLDLVRQVVQLRPHLRLLVAHSGDEALALARAHRPDLMLLDLALGDMTGEELMRRLLAERLPAPCVVLANDPQADRVARALRGGFVDCLAKPLDVAALMRTLDRLLGTPSRFTPLASA